MATTTAETYDRQGNLISSRTVEVPPEVTNRDTSLQRADGALDQLRAYQALANPTNAQTVAAVRVLCRAVVALIRLQLARHEGTD